jgi:LCP family protein required for cell wall assembly
MPRARDKDRPTVARHAPQHTPGRLAGALKLLGVALGVIVVSAVAVAAFLVIDFANRVNHDAVALEGAPEVQPPSLEAYPGEFSVLLIGTDECGEVSTELLGKRCSEADGGVLNDVTLLVHVSAEPRNVSVVSFPRDLGVPVPECQRPDGSTAPAMSKASINTIFEHAGLSCVAKTVSELSGMEIPFAAKIDFDGVMEVTDAIGGVEVCIGGDGIRDGKTNIDWAPGPRTVSGYEALQFIRTRQGVGDGSDLARISNQQQYMSRLVKKIMSDEVLTNPGLVLRLANTIADNIQPSEGLPAAIPQLALAIKDVPFREFAFLQYPNGVDPDDENKVVPNEEAAETLWDALKAGQPVQLTGDATNNGGVEVVSPAPGTEAETEAPATEAPTTEAPATDVPAPRVTLDPSISGQTADQETCANGRRN